MSHKSLILSMAWTEVERSHACRYNKTHVLKKGDKRLTITEDGSKLNYCVHCAKIFLAKDIKRLQVLLDEAG